MRNFTEKIVNMMKAEKLFQTQGGPIIMSQARKWDLNKIFILRIAFKFQLCILSCYFFMTEVLLVRSTNQLQ